MRHLIQHNINCVVLKREKLFKLVVNATQFTQNSLLLYVTQFKTRLK